MAFPGLHTLRGFAVTAVFLFHVAVICLLDLGLRSGIVTLAAAVGGFAVDLFFVLSGFLITFGLLTADDAPNVRTRFFIRRAFRILPAYFVFLAVAMFLWPAVADRLSLDPALPLGSAGYEGIPRTAYWLFISNVFQAGATDGGWPALSITWSLCIEVHFYLLWPFLIRWCPRSALTPTFLGLIAFAAVLRWGLIEAGFEEAAVYYLTPTRIDALAAGALIAHPLTGSRTLVRWPYALAGFAAGLSVLTITALSGSIGFLTSSLVIAAKYTVITGTFFCLVWMVVGDRRVGLFLERWVPLRWLGTISYGVYLWHFLALLAVLQGLKALGILGGFAVDAATAMTWLIGVCAPLSLGLALLSWLAIERPAGLVRDRVLKWLRL